MNTGHLAAIAARLGRKITWDPAAEKIMGDDQAAAFAARTPRADCGPHRPRPPCSQDDRVGLWIARCDFVISPSDPWHNDVQARTVSQPATTRRPPPDRSWSPSPTDSCYYCSMDTMLEIAKRVDDFMMERSPVHDTMRRLAQTFGDLGIPFAIAGAMAANAHGHRRTTADVDVLVRREDLVRFKDRWIGRGWLDLFEGSKGFRDTLNGVKVDVLIVGEYPGDGRPKPVSFPAPESVREVHDERVPYVNLVSLLELKIASGMTAAHRLQDLADAIQLIRVNALPRNYAGQLNPFVRAKFDELWQAAQVSEDF